MVRYSKYSGKINNPVLAATALLIFLSLLLQSVLGTAYYSLAMNHYASVNSPPVILQSGTAGTSTIYTNSTSAKISVEAPLFDYVDNNDPNMDSSADKGTHLNFTAQQASPDSTYDTLTEENMEASVDYVDNNSSDVDSSSDVGTHSNFENQKARDSSYDTLTEQNTEVVEIAKVGTDTSGTGTTSPLGFSHTLVTGSDRLVVISVGIENNGDVGTVSVTYSGQSMTLAVEGKTATTGYIYYCGIFYILEANLPSEGSQQVSISITGTPLTMEINGFCSEYAGVTQGAPEATDNTDEPSPANDTIENAISPSTGAWVISAVGCGNVGSFTHGQGQVEILDLADSSSTFAVAELRGASGETSLDSTYATGANRMDRVASSWTGVAAEDNYELDLEIQFTGVIDFLPTETLCINTGAFSGTEDINMDFWNGTGWENLTADLTAHSCNYYAVSLTSSTFTIRFKDGTTTGDTTQDKWQIDASLLRVEGVGGKEDAVDNNASDVDSSTDLGDLIGFDSMRAADSAYANLTELAPGNIAYINAAEANATSGTSAQVNKPTGTVENDFMMALLVSTIGSDTDGSTMSSTPAGWTLEHDYVQTTTSGQHVYVYWKVAGASEPSSYTWTWTSFCGWVAQITTFRGVDTASPIHAEGTVNQEISNSPMSPSITTTADNAMIWLYDITDGSVIPASGGAPSGSTWVDQTEVASPGNGVGISTAYFVQASAGATGNRDWTLDASDENSGQQYALKPAPTDYQLDHEVQWTDAVYSLPNEELCIYGGAIGAEDINVDAWNGTGWESVFTDLSSGWNNASITNWLTTSSFTIRFKGENETGDSSQDTWQIDVALVHVWYDAGENYELDLEVQWMNADYTRTNKELCIKTGTFSGSENIQVKIWNITGSSWNWIMNLTASQWNNVSITSYLTSSTFTVQLLGGTETDDASEDSWNIDATLLHVWTHSATYDYVLKVNNTVTDSWQIRLKKYSDSNINRLQNCTIYFHNSTDGSSGQIKIENGAYTKNVGSWYTLAPFSTIYVAMAVEADSKGMSNVYAYLEILIPDTTTYAQYIITFEII
jgi:hypothetical protein